ncbi:MAG TPA: VCBS repeat-containing protein [Candidatus Hydrogenedentes bacterium]|nr:VCBS repeat-containing protein [Candidatus Hydrogenedentota bacterium]
MSRLGCCAVLWAASAVSWGGTPAAIMEMPGLWAEFAAGPVARVTGNFSHADLNRDGQPELILERSVWIRERGPGWSRTIPLPEEFSGGFYDVDREGILWLMSRDGLKGWRLEDSGDRWEPLGLFPLEKATAEKGKEPENRPGRRRFLHDIDEDGWDDAVVITPRGAYWHRRTKEDFRREGALLISFPPPRLIYGTPGTLWPPEQRALAFPTRRLSCEISIAAGVITLVSGEPMGDRMFWTVRQQALTGAAGRDPASGVDPLQQLDVPGDAMPVWLDRGSPAPGFARFKRETDSPDGRGDPVAVCEVWAPGQGTPQVFRRPAPPGTALCPPLADVDGDGLMDVALLTAGMPRRGPREQAQEFLTGSRLQLDAAVWLGRNGGYASQPSWKGSLDIQLDAPPVRQPQLLQRAARKPLASLIGDFNGDGQADLMVRDRLDRVSVYACGAGGISGQPLFTLAVAADEAAIPADVNGDGRADVICMPESGTRPTRVALTEGDNP